MYCGKIAPWEHYPKSLRFGEVQNPLRVIIDFFSAGWPKDHRSDLKKWRHFLVKGTHFKDKHGPGTLVFIYDLNVKLVEALHLLLLAHKNNRDPLEAVTPAQLENERLDWPYFPKNLSEEELTDPYKAIKKCFKKLQPQQYRDYLQDWLHGALYNQPVDESMLAGEIITIYENLRRLYSAAWLIHQRETEQTITQTAWDKTKFVNQPGALLVDKPVLLKGIDGDLSPAELSGLKEVQQLIVDRIPLAQFIVCIGRHDNPFTYYLVIGIDESERLHEHEISNKIEDNCRYLVNVYAIVHKTSSAIDGIENAKRFWTHVFSKGLVIYTAPGLELPQVKEINRDVLLQRAEFHWKRWGMQGKDFLKGAERYFAEDNYRLASFLLHQSAESILKSIIQAVLGYRIQVHNLSRLLRLTLLFTTALQNVFELESEEGNRLYALLRGSYTEARYNNEFDTDKRSVELLITRVKLLFDVTECLYEQYIATLDT